jgi:hypothetical protein
MLRLPIPVVHHEGALNAARHAAFLFAKRRVAEGGRWKSSSCQGKAECRHSIPGASPLQQKRAMLSALKQTSAVLDGARRCETVGCCGSGRTPTKMLHRSFALLGALGLGYSRVDQMATVTRLGSAAGNASHSGVRWLDRRNDDLVRTRWVLLLRTLSQRRRRQHSPVRY